MPGKWALSKITVGRIVMTPNGKGVVVGNTKLQIRDLELKPFVLVDHGQRGLGGVVDLVAYPPLAIKEVEE